MSTVVPAWGIGWSEILRDEYVSDVLSWLGHYARQYIHRSYVAKVLMIAWERDGVVLHPFGSHIHMGRYGVVSPPTLPSRALRSAVEESVTSWGEIEKAPRSRSKWIRRNTLEPMIHQGVFHFLRGQTLMSSGFEIEALVAFDCVMQSLQMMPWTTPVGDPRRNRSDLVATLRLAASNRELAEDVYFLRNQFAAHAGGWRWWDVGEYVDEDFLEKVSDLTLGLLCGAADTEPTLRRIDPRPDSWGAWLMESFPLIFYAIWFQANR